jgi:hypothetical protein
MVRRPVILNATTINKFMNFIISFGLVAACSFVFFFHGALLLGTEVAALAAAYGKWWDAVYPVMVERGGDREFVWNVPTSDKAKGTTEETKPSR